jgi:hypothetical protein
MTQALCRAGLTRRYRAERAAPVFARNPQFNRRRGAL